MKDGYWCCSYHCNYSQCWVVADHSGSKAALVTLYLLALRSWLNSAISRGLGWSMVNQQICRNYMFLQTSVGSRHLLILGKGYSPISGAQDMSENDMHRPPGSFDPSQPWLGMWRWQVQVRKPAGQGRMKDFHCQRSSLADLGSLIFSVWDNC